MIYDIFNGDADGICALVQLRLATPAESTLVTGVKRDIVLLDKVDAKEGDHLNVLDVSFDKNKLGVERALTSGASVFYMDHHFAGDIPEHKRLETHINTAPEVCTSLLMNGYLKNQYSHWAVVGAFGDNLRNSAVAIAKPLSLTDAELDQLEKLGIYMNYNGYGASVDDLHFAPDDLYKAVLPYNNPLNFIADAGPNFDKLEQGYEVDMANAKAIMPEYDASHCSVFVFPNEAWARRVSGVYGNDLAQQYKSKAHAVITSRKDGDYQVSVRAPLDNRTGADELCRQFPTGGGRAAAAGINNLPPEQLDHFIETFQQFYR